eukprot:6788682-Pyramimonas_sp.AAC.2
MKHMNLLSRISRLEERDLEPRRTLWCDCRDVVDGEGEQAIANSADSTHGKGAGEQCSRVVSKAPVSEGHAANIRPIGTSQFGCDYFLIGNSGKFATCNPCCAIMRGG